MAKRVMLTADITRPDSRGTPMARNDYAFAKRQKDIARRLKKEEKRKHKVEAQQAPVQEEADASVDQAASVTDN
jgi:hypothetical protein